MFDDQPIDSNVKRYKEIRKSTTSLSAGKKFMTNQLILMKRYKEIRTATTAQGEDYTTGCLLDYDYIKNPSRLITVDLRRQKELDADPKAIKQIELVGQSKNQDNAIFAI